MAESMWFEPPTALEYFASLVAEDASLPVLEAAASLAQDAYAVFDPQSVPAQVDALAATLRRRLPPDAAPVQRLRVLNRYFFGELGFQGNVNDFHDPRNSYLCDVLERRLGIPITLALIYVELATQAGLVAEGVSFPDHFLVCLRLPQGEAVIDPFSGRSLSQPELEERLQPWAIAQTGRAAAGQALARWLRPATPRQIVARMLRNLARIHQTRGDDRALLAVRERMVALLPDDGVQRRDRGLARGRLGQLALACDDLADYLARHADAPDARAMAAQWRAWGGADDGPRCAS